RLTEPIPERGLVAAVAGAAVEADAADQAVGFLQRDGKAARSPGGVVLPHASDPLAPIGFSVGMRYGADPASDFPIPGQRDEVSKIVIAVGSDAQPRCFDDDAGWCHQPSSTVGVISIFSGSGCQPDSH